MVINDYDNNIDVSLNELLNKRFQKVNINTSFISTTLSRLINDVKQNKTVQEEKKEFFIKKELRESDYLILNIGMLELSKLYQPFDTGRNYLLLNKMYQRIQTAIVEIKKYAKDTIIFIGYYNPTNYYDSNTDSLFYSFDIKMNRLMMDNGIIYISTYELVKGNNYKDSSYWLNNEGKTKMVQIINFYIN